MIEPIVLKYSRGSGFWIDLVQRETVASDPDIATDILSQGKHDTEIQHRIVLPITAGRINAAHALIGSKPDVPRRVLKDHVDMIGQQRIRIPGLMGQFFD